MEFDPFTIHYKRRQRKREAYKPVLRALVEGLASLVEGQRCFANEFGLSYGRVFNDHLEFFKGKDSCKVISEWLRGGEEGAFMLKSLFDDLAQHQVALLEAFGELAGESVDPGKLKRGELAGRYGFDTKLGPAKSKQNCEQQIDAYQQLLITLFVARYAQAREQMRASTEAGNKERHEGSATFK